MTITSQTSVISTQSFRHRRHTQGTYQVVINGEDGNYQEFELEASSFTEAEAKANEIAAGSMIDVTFVEIYRIH
jgi:hypothetical protein